MFKNSGFAAGASLEHVHSQLVALPYVPPLVQTELDGAERHYAARGRCVFCELIERETAGGERLVFMNEDYVVICAYAGRQPYETWILPQRHLARFDRLDDDAMAAMGSVVMEILLRLAAQAVRLGTTLAYNLILHTGPFDADDTTGAAYHWHWELIPRTTHLAGLEWGGGVFINPVSPERAAESLRSL